MLKDTQNNNELTELRKIDPNLANIISSEIERKEPSEEYQKKMFDALKAYEKNSVKQETGKTFIWQQWVKPIITPIRQFEELFKLQGFPIVDFRVPVTALMVIIVSFGAYYFIYKSAENPVLISKNTYPTPKATDTERNFFGEGKGKELKEVKIILLSFSEDERVLLLKEKIINELNKSQLNISTDPKEADARLSISSQKGQILIELENVNEKTLWSTSFSSDETNFPLLQDLFSKIEQEKH